MTLPGEPEYRVPPNVAWVDGADFGLAEELYLTIVPEGRTVLLKDTARLIWHVAAEGSDDVVRDVAEIAGLTPDEVADDVRTFLADLTTRGLLLPRGR
ncbi:MAG: PqqD family protein [Actinomycetales bacterium]|nr:PqqD family protein [Actinomycetales bacterium]